jgi:hypothetical protein
MFSEWIKRPAIMDGGRESVTPDWSLEGCPARRHIKNNKATSFEM